MTGFTYGGSATLLDLPAGASGVPDQKAATAVLPDGSLLVAATVDLSTHIWHLTETLDVTGTATVAGSNPILIPTDDGAILTVTDGTNGYSHAVTAGPTISPAHSIGTPILGFSFGANDFMTVAPWIDGDNIYILTRDRLDILTTTGARVARHTLPGMVTAAAYPHGDHALVLDWDGGLHRLGYDGTVTALGASAASWPVAATDPAQPWRVTEQGTGPTAIVMDSDGSNVSTYATGDWRARPGFTARDNQSGALSITTWIPDDAEFEFAAYIDHLTTDGISHQRIPLGYYGELSGGSMSMAQSRGRWVAAAVLDGRSATPAFGARRLTVFTGTVPYVTSRLHVGIQTATGKIHRKVGDESWEHGPGRLKLRVPRSQSPSGWLMEVKPGDDASNAHPMRLKIIDPATGVRYGQVVRMIPWLGRQ